MSLAIKQELILRRHFLSEPIESIYFGGGTPSLMPDALLSDLLAVIGSEFEVTPEAEVTLEANPDDVTDAIAQTWRRLGITRISLGVQSFFDEDLEFMNRAHNQRQALAAIQKVQQAGFSWISCDLIYGSPHHQRSDVERKSAANLRARYWTPVRLCPHRGATYGLGAQDRQGKDV